METIKNIWVGKDMYRFEIVLQQWILVLDRLYYDWKRDDFPWWYNERASVSTFAAAIWLSGGSAFEEYSSEKKRNEAKSKVTPGRTDIFFSYNNKDYLGEAKQYWPWLANHPTCNREFHEKLNLAEDDATSIRNEAGIKTAILFASPKIKQSNSGKLKMLIDEWIEFLDENNNYSARAFFFPKHGLNAVFNGRIYPGIALFLKRLNV
jgi:hypothetical protein